MSNDNPSSSAHWQSFLGPASQRTNTARSNKTPQALWNQAAADHNNRRGLAPLATSNLNTGSADSGRRSAQLNSPEAVTSSPTNTSPFPTLSSSLRTFGRRATPPTSSSGSPFTSLQSGALQQQILSSRYSTQLNRAATPSQPPGTATAGSYFYTPLGAGGGGGSSVGSRSGAYSPSLAGPAIGSPTSLHFERSPSISSNSNPLPSHSSFSKISATQLLLLLDTLNDREGQAKWESKAEKIRNLLQSNGMEVFAQFFSRTVASNRGAIFLGREPTDSYKLLREQVERVLTDPEQTAYIANAVETSKDDIFRDFDVAAFAQHFFKDPLAQSILANAFINSPRQDLRMKSENFLSEKARGAFQSLMDARRTPVLPNSKVLALFIESFALTGIGGISKDDIFYALGHRFDGSDPPKEIINMVPVLRLPNQDIRLVSMLHSRGPKATSSQATALELLSAVSTEQINESEVTNVLVYMIASPNALTYNLNNYVTAFRSKFNGMPISWQRVIQGLDIAELRIEPEGFLRLLNSLLPVAVEDSAFDIQRLWGGIWQNQVTQTSFLRAFLSNQTKDIRPSTIPKFRYAFSVDDFKALSPEFQQRVHTERESHWSSSDAMGAIVEVVLGGEPLSQDNKDAMDILNDVFSTHMASFMLSLARRLSAAKWTANQEKFIEQCAWALIERQTAEHDFILQALFHQDQFFLFNICALTFQMDPIRTRTIYNRVEGLGWLDIFLQFWQNPLALDMACVRDSLHPDWDLDRYLTDCVERGADRGAAGLILWKFLRIKADDEHRVQRNQMAPQTSPLSLKTVQIFLSKVSEYVKTDREQLKAAQATCLQCYPRLINYGTGFDEILDRRCAETGNKLPPGIDVQMSELFGNMYRGELTIRDMVTRMREYKTSHDADLQDLFCCIVHGMFDEYICYNEYPEDALEKTALLFGSIVKYRLLERIPQEFALALILESVRDYPADSLMHRFGIEALLQISERFSEWPGFCNLLLQIPQLHNEEIIQKAQESLKAGSESINDADDLPNGIEATYNLTNGRDTLKQERLFKAIHADPPYSSLDFQDPDERAQEKILFVINNLSKDNMAAKLDDLREVLVEEHFQWFAAYLVEQRAKLEPNNQGMYFDFIAKLDNNLLMTEVIRETYVSVFKMINAESTVNSATERSHLKNLGGWLGSLTLAQDKPIRHKNIYFIELLVEGYDTQKLLVVIPFTCKVLVQGGKSTIFRPPNPWLMEIVGLLLELYHFADLKLNLKFEIEVLCKDLSLDHKKIEPAFVIRDRQADDNLTNISALPDGMDAFDDLSLNAMNRGVRERLTAGEIMATLPSLEDVLKYPPTSGTPGEQSFVRDVIYRAFDQAIQEIIAPVVERSITIASISTAQLVAKDYAVELDVERYRSAARQMVKSLAGSLALVTCKEPLRMSITNYIRKPNGEDLHDHPLPEGAILMCVNDNLDTACSFVEQAGAERSVLEIEHVIEPELEERRRVIAENGSRDFLAQNLNRWSAWVSDPYKQTLSGLNDAQRAVYEDFDRRVHGMNLTHAQSSSDSAVRQLPDILQEPLSMPNMSTPAGQSVLPHEASISQQEVRSEPPQHPRVNGFHDNLPPHERIFMLIEDVLRAVRSSITTRLKDVDRNGSIFQDVRQILVVLTTSLRPGTDVLARQTAEKVCGIMVQKPATNTMEAELLAFLLSKVCQISELISRDVLRWIALNEEALMTSSFMTTALLSVGLMDFCRVDALIAQYLRAHNEQVLQLLADLMDQTLFNEEPIAIRADFVTSTIAMSSWLRENPELDIAHEVQRKLKAHGMPNFVEIAPTDKDAFRIDQMRYVFLEWVGFFDNSSPDEKTFAAFLRDLQNEETFTNAGSLAEFLRLCLDSCVDAFEEEASSMKGSLQEAFLRTDALARLVMMLVRFHGSANGSTKHSRVEHLRSMLSTLVLVTNHYQVRHGTSFPQRVFFRLYSGIFYQYASLDFAEVADHEEIMLVFAEMLTNLQPTFFGHFSYGWVGLLSHRVFLDGMLGQRKPRLWTSYKILVGIMLEFMSKLEDTSVLQPMAADFYRGVSRNLLVLHHDYQEFLSENYSYLCARAPYHFAQVRNIMLTSRPSTYQDLPDPTTPGLKADRLEEMKRNPLLPTDIDEPLKQGELVKVVNSALGTSGDLDGCVKHIVEHLPLDGLDKNITKRRELFSALVPHIGQHAVGTKAGNFDEQSSHVTVFTKLLESLGFEDRYHLINTIADQIRYPNTHTDYFCKLMLHLFGMTERALEGRSIILRVITERLTVSRPHPWGMTLLGIEVLNNTSHGLWNTLDPTNKEVKQRLRQAVGMSH